MATFPAPASRYTVPPHADRILLAEQLSEIAERAQSFTGATGVIIAMRTNNELVVRTSNGIAPDVGACIPFPSGVTGLSVTTRKPQTCASADAEAQLEAVFRAIGTRSVLSVPVQWDGEVRGVLTVLAQVPEAFNRTHIAILMTLRDVIANKLSQCGLPSDPPRPAAPAPGQAIELEVDSLLKPTRGPVAVRKPAPAPTERGAAPVPPATPVAPALVQPTRATPAAGAEQTPPVAAASPQPAAKPLAELLKEPAEKPVAMNPDVLCPGDDPSRFGCLPKPRKLAERPALHPMAVPLEAPSPIFAAYRPATKSRGISHLVFAASVAAVVVLAVALYPWRKHSLAASPAPVSVADQQVPAPAPEPSLLPLPKMVEPSPAPAPAKPAAPPATTREQVKRVAAEEPKPAVKETVQQPVPVLHLASARPATKLEEPVEPPAVGLLAASPMPNLPAAPAPAASLAPRKAAVVPATLLQSKNPQYPEAARRMGVSGLVKLEISISAKGKVTDVRALSGDLLLRQASVAAVREWVYRPAYLDGNPVASSAVVTLHFNSPGNNR